MITLTERQKKIVSFIEQWFSDYDYAPSVRDIQIGCDISSTSVVQYNLDKLKSLGILKSHSEVSRSLRLIQFKKKQLYPFEKIRNQTHELVAVPMLGTIAAGTPFPLPENETWSDMDNKEYIDLPQSIVGIGNDIYALKVKGKSMIDSLISDGDMVIMQHQFEYLVGENRRKMYSSLVVYGDDSQNTAMAKTVGLPIAIATSLLVGPIAKRFVDKITK